MKSATEIPSTCPFESIAIVGVGLIGGSIAASLKARQHRGRILGVGRNLARLEAARKQGLLDEIGTGSDGCVQSADLVIVCTPVDRIVADVRELARHVSADATLTDAGSVKGPVCRSLENSIPGERLFIGSHPLAGSEKQGFEHSQADLFQNKLCVMTPVDSTPGGALERLESFWRFLGARTVRMTPEAHDTAVAMTSHTPHVIASALAAALPEEFLSLAARGFRDTTRIAAGDPDLWVAIVQQNQAAVLEAMDRFASVFQAFRESIALSDGERLKKLLEVGKRVRDAIGDQ